MVADLLSGLPYPAGQPPRVVLWLTVFEPGPIWLSTLLAPLVQRAAELPGTGFWSGLAIVGMALVTYLTRIGGLWLIDRLAAHPAGRPRLEAWLGYVPGAVLVAIVAPAVRDGGPTDALAAALAGLVAWRSGNLLLAVGAGIGAAWLLPSLLGRFL